MFADPLGGNGSVLRRKRKRNHKQRYQPHADIVALAFRATARRDRLSRSRAADPSSRRRSWLRQNTARTKASGRPRRQRPPPPDRSPSSSLSASRPPPTGDDSPH